MVGTLLTLLFLSALYVAWSRIQPGHDDGPSTQETADLADDISSSERMPAQNEPAPVLETQI